MLKVDSGVRPPIVEEALGFFSRHGLWHIVTRNSQATSCRDAAARRSRLGTVGIPLYDELKSLCVAIQRSGKREFALLHCRADSTFDLDAVSHVLRTGQPVEKVSPLELSELFNTAYGRVNPFTIGLGVIQVFDTGIKCRLTAPHTMMTNAGDHTWALEFVPEDVIEALATEGEVQIACITTGQRHNTDLPSFGIITGNGPESGMALWRHINDQIYQNLQWDGRLHGDLSYPHIIVDSIPEMGLSMQLAERTDQVWQVLGQAVDRLCEAGVNIIALACNTTQFYADRIHQRLAGRPTRFISMPDVVSSYLQANTITDISIVGIPAVADLGQHSSYSPLKQFGLLPGSKDILEDLQLIGYMVKKLGHGEKNSTVFNKLRDIIRGSGTKHVLIALTEISILLQQFPKQTEQMAGHILIDSLKIYGQALADIYLKALPMAPTLDDKDEILF